MFIGLAWHAAYLAPNIRAMIFLSRFHAWYITWREPKNWAVSSEQRVVSGEWSCLEIMFTITPNPSNSNNIVSVHKLVTLPFVFMFCCWCCWIMMHYLFKYGSWVDIRIQCHTKKCTQGKGSVPIAKSLQRGENASLLMRLEHGIL